jgi:hypothetical protein
MLIILRFLKTDLETCKTPDTFYNALWKMRKRILLEMVINYRKIIETFVYIFGRKT